MNFYKKILGGLLIISLSNLIASEINFPLNFNKSETKVMKFGQKNLALAFVKQENSKYNFIVQTTGSNQSRYKVCKRISGKKIACAKYGNGGKLIHKISYFDLDIYDGKHGNYKQYFTAYIGNKNKYDCPIVVWDNKTSKFISEDKRTICKDEFRIKYDGFYNKGKKSGTWKITDKKGNSKDKQYRN